MKQRIDSRKVTHRFHEATHRSRRNQRAAHQPWGHHVSIKERLLHHRERDQRRLYTAECLEYGYQP